MRSSKPWLAPKGAPFHDQANVTLPGALAPSDGSTRIGADDGKGAGVNGVRVGVGVLVGLGVTGVLLWVTVGVEVGV